MQYVECTCSALLEKKGSKIILQLSPWDNSFWFQGEPFLVPHRGLHGTKKGSMWKGSYMEPKRFFLKGYPMGTAE